MVNKKLICSKCGSPLQIVCPQCRLEQSIDDYIEELTSKNQTGLANQLQKAEVEASKWEESYNELLLDKDRLSKSITALQSNTVSAYSKGKAQQLSIKDAIRQAFPNDYIKLVSDGANGADIEVYFGGVESPWAKVLIESKNAKQWTTNWITKLRNDKITSNADLAILATRTRGKYTSDSGIAVMDLDNVVPFLEMARPFLQGVSSQKSLLNNDKMTKAYTYITTTMLDRLKQAITTAKKFNDRGNALIKQGEQCRRDAVELIRTLSDTREEIIPLLGTGETKLLKEGQENAYSVAGCRCSGTGDTLA